MQVKHKFTSAKADGPDSTRLRPSAWNDDHDVLASTDGVVIGRAAGLGAGAMSEIPFSQLLPLGLCLPYAGATAPSGWLLSYGQAVSRTTYAALFAVIGTTYGPGDGATTFNLPDLRGMVPGGKSNMGGSDRGNLTGGGTLGAALGQQTRSTTVAVTVSGSISGSTSGGLSVSVGGSTDGPNTLSSAPSGGNTVAPNHTHNISGSGGTSGSLGVSGSFSGSGSGTTGTFSIVQPTIILNYIINTGV